jgi:hypothetical protein
MIQKCEKCAAHNHDKPAAAPAPAVKGSSMADVFGGSQTVAQYKAQKAAQAATCGYCGNAKVSMDGMCPYCQRRVAPGSAGDPFDYGLQKVNCACNRNRW